MSSLLLAASAAVSPAWVLGGGRTPGVLPACLQEVLVPAHPLLDELVSSLRGVFLTVSPHILSCSSQLPDRGGCPQLLTCTQWHCNFQKKPDLKNLSTQASAPPTPLRVPVLTEAGLLRPFSSLPWPLGALPFPFPRRNPSSPMSVTPGQLGVSCLSSSAHLQSVSRFSLAGLACHSSHGRHSCPHICFCVTCNLVVERKVVKTFSSAPFSCLKGRKDRGTSPQGQGLIGHSHQRAPQGSFVKNA